MVLSCHIGSATMMYIIHNESIISWQLYTNGENHGIHALLVRIRDDDLNVMPNVRVEDMGYKLGLNGVDNAKLIFDNIRIPRENLLDKSVSIESHCVSCCTIGLL